MASVTFPPYHPPPGFVCSEAVESSYALVLIGLPLSSILVPILLFILFFSAPSSRRTFLFAVNVLIVLLGLAEGVLNTILQSFIILYPHQPVSIGLFMAYLAFTFCTPIVVDSVLILRLSSVYPVTLTSQTTRLAILSVPLFCSAARFACVSVFMRQWTLGVDKGHPLFTRPLVWPQNRMVIADWSIQLFENFYCSALFLLRLRGHRAFSSRMYRNQTIATRLRVIFYIAVSNFVFPTLFSIVQLIYIIHDPSMVDGAIFLTINNYVSIIGVLFSTLWCFNPTWKGTYNHPLSFQPETNLTLPQSMITLSGIAPNIPSGPSESRQRYPLRIWRKSRPRGHRSYVSRSHSQIDVKSIRRDLGRDTLDMAKDSGSVDYFQPLDLPRIVVPADGDESEVESHSRSPITPCDSGPRSESKSVGIWTREQRGCAEVPSCADTISAIELDADGECDLEFATPTSSLAVPYERNQRRHSLSALFGSSDARGSHAAVSDAGSQPCPTTYLKPPSPSRTRTRSASFSGGADPVERLRPLGWDGRPP